MEPVVRYDRETMRGWLLGRDGVQDSYAANLADDLDITAGSNPQDGELLTSIDDLLAREPQGWITRPDVQHIALWPNPDGAVITLDVDGFPRVASLHQDNKWLSDRKGIESVLDALGHVAKSANILGEEVEKVRAGRLASTASSEPSIVDDAFSLGRQGYGLTRVYRLGSGHTVRVRIRRDFYAFQSHAIAEVLTPALTWTQLAEEAPSEWHEGTPYVDAETNRDRPRPTPGTHKAKELVDEIAGRLVKRAAAVLPPA